MRNPQPDNDELHDVYDKYHTRKEETRYERWLVLPELIERSTPAACQNCGDLTEFRSWQTSCPIPMCSEVCNDEWWYQYFKASKEKEATND